MLVGFAVSIENYQQNGIADHHTYEDHVRNVDSVQKAHSVALRPEGKVDKEIECDSRNQQQDAMSHPAFGQVRLPLPVHESDIVTRHPPVDTLEYPVDADRNKDDTDQGHRSVNLVSHLGLKIEVPGHYAVKPLNNSCHKTRL